MLFSKSDLASGMHRQLEYHACILWEPPQFGAIFLARDRGRLAGVEKSRGDGMKGTMACRDRAHSQQLHSAKRAPALEHSRSKQKAYAALLQPG